MLAQHLPEIVRDGLVDLLQVDHLIALDHAQPQAAVGLEFYDFHERSSLDDCLLNRSVEQHQRCREFGMLPLTI